MREIKFRGIPIEDYGDTKWLYGSAIMGYEDKLAYIEANYQGCVPVKWETVSQYTGLKDSKGNEIYEGDIVRISAHPFDIDNNYEVGYNEYMELSCGSYYLSKMRNWAEVIGNIYENRNLLDEGGGL